VHRDYLQRYFVTDDVGENLEYIRFDYNTNKKLSFAFV